MKILIITVIALVIPAFFLFVLIMGTCGRLSALRRRCRQLAPARNATTSPGYRPDDRAYMEALARYDAARGTFPASLISRLFGFGPMDHSSRTVGMTDSQR